MPVKQGNHATSYTSRFGAMSYVTAVGVSTFLSVHIQSVNLS
jgi:hypothetical protein